MKNNKLILVAVLLLFVKAGSAQPATKAKLDSLVNTIASKDEAMFSVAITQNGTLIYDRAVGYGDITVSPKIPVTADTRYRIGSITKVFTSAIVFQLIEEGKLQLMTPLSKFYPDLPNASQITIANLLNHSSGLYNITEDSTYPAMQDKHMTKDAMLVRFKSKASVFEPGSKHVYSNTNFILLGYIIETLDGKPYAEVLQKRICSKIGLKSTYYGGKINTGNKEARSYQWQDGWVPDTETDMSIPAGAGAIVSTPIEVNKFMSALFCGKLISDSSLKHMTTIVDGYGMDLVSRNLEGRTGYGHAGGIDGFRSLSIYFPEEKLVITYTANAVKTSLNKTIATMISACFNNDLNHN